MFSLFYNGHSSEEFGILISGGGTYNSPEREVETVSVPGRNGDLIIDKGRFKNIKVTYPAVIKSGLEYNAERARQWLCSSSSYCRLTDDYHGDEFRMARFSGSMKMSTWRLNKGGTFNLEFDCKPQRFLISGEIEHEFESAGTIVNQTEFVAKPLITVYGDGIGTMTINGKILSLTGISEYIVLDSEAQNAYKGTQNKNASVTGEFPVLVPGENEITFTGGITKVVIIPRWWTV